MGRRARRRSSGNLWGRALVAGSLGLMLGVTILPATAGAASTPGVTSSTITIGATVPLTGPAAPGYDEIAPAMEAVFSYVNAHGGVDGRKINYTYLDDGYNPANTATLTRKLVLQDNIFADVGPLGTPTQAAVQGFLNSQKVPQLFIESGCNCWSNPKYPLSYGWQPPYTVDGKILGAYIKANFAGKKIGYLSQADEFGQDVVKGLDMEIPASSVVSRQTYDVATLAGPLSNQMAALKAAGAQVVARAMQKYGMFLADGGNIALTAANDQFTAHKWADVGIDSHALKAIQVTDMEVVDMGATYSIMDCTRNP